MSILLGTNEETIKENEKLTRHSLTAGLTRFSVFSSMTQSTAASTNLEGSMFLMSASQVASPSYFEFFSNSDVLDAKKDDGQFGASVNSNLKMQEKTVFEEDFEASDEDQFNNRGSELEDVSPHVRKDVKKPADVEKQMSERSVGSDQSSGHKHKLHSRIEV